jgi:hypothetical protein
MSDEWWPDPPHDNDEHILTQGQWEGCLQALADRKQLLEAYKRLETDGGQPRPKGSNLGAGAPLSCVGISALGRAVAIRAGNLHLRPTPIDRYRRYLDYLGRHSDFWPRPPQVSRLVSLCSYGPCSLGVHCKSMGHSVIGRPLRLNWTGRRTGIHCTPLTGHWTGREGHWRGIGDLAVPFTAPMVPVRVEHRRP